MNSNCLESVAILVGVFNDERGWSSELSLSSALSSSSSSPPSFFPSSSFPSSSPSFFSSSPFSFSFFAVGLLWLFFLAGGGEVPEGGEAVVLGGAFRELSGFGLSSLGCAFLFLGQGGAGSFLRRRTRSSRSLFAFSSSLFSGVVSLFLRFLGEVAFFLAERPLAAVQALEGMLFNGGPFAW